MSEKKLGRPKDSTSGPRPIFWFCVAIIDGSLIVEKIYSPLNAQLSDIKSFSNSELNDLFENLRNFSKEEAVEIFKFKHQIDPQFVEGPCLMKGGEASPVKKKIQKDQNFELMPSSRPAVFNNWKGVAYSIKDRDDLMFFIYGEPVMPASDGKVTAPTSGAVAVSQLKFLSNSSNESVNN